MSAVMTMLSPGEAQRLTQRIKLIASGVRDNLVKLRNLVDEAKASNVHQVLGYPSWTAYLADTLAAEPMRLDRAERQQLVEYLSGEGMSTRAIAPIVGVSQKTVDRAVRESNDSPAQSVDAIDRDVEEAAAATHISQPESTPSISPEPVADQATGEIIEADDEPERVTPGVSGRPVVGLDGKTYTTQQARKPQRKALTDSAKDIGWELRKATEKLQRMTEDDRFSRNKEEVAAHLRGHLFFTVDVCQDLLDVLNQSGKD